MKNVYKHRHKVQKRQSRKNLFLVTGMIIFLALIGGSVVWATGYLPSFKHQQNNSAKPTAKVAQIHSTKVAQPAPVVSNATPKPVHDYQFPAIQNDMAPIISRIPTKERVVFLTIDDGIVTNPNDGQIMQAAHVKATFFLVHRFISSDWNFFGDLAQQTGSDIQNHSYDHYSLPGKSYDYQKQDICTNADALQQWFGKRPIFFRPSGGGYDATTQKAAADCGMRAIILWDAAVNNGAVQYQHGSMQPGDIVLMHFRTTFNEDLNAFAKAAQNAGLQPALLVDWAT